tara:strand:+ start:3814 stop:4380 length:567 start_codon:yes stop_codon:yes gene_type:complete
LIVNDLASSHPVKPSNCGFTLLEVIIALSVFGFLIGGLLALLPWGVEGAGNVRDRNVAYGMTDAIQVELELMGFGLVESLTDENRVLDLVAPADGREVRWEPNDNQISEYPIAVSQLDELDQELPAGQRYFLIRCSQFPEDNRHEHDPSNGYLGLQVDVQWPYKTLDAEGGVEERIRSHFHFPLAITR